MQEMGLESIANTVIGSASLGGDTGGEPGLGANTGGGISGGQRRRLSIAIELLGKPRALLLDEVM
jgi:ABC-type multidrug transport system ATPase subunit